jgi:iron complex transport system substrate-binding protein
MKKSIVAILLGLVAIIMAACGTSGNAEEDATENSETANKPETVVVAHELGETEVEKNPKKVVVFDFGSLDTLDKLGIDVVGVPQATIPSYLEKYASDEYENVGHVYEPDFEKIAEIDPDLIIISGRQAEVYDQLQELGNTIHLGVDTTRYMDSFKENAKIIGRIFEKEDEVETALAEIDDRIAMLNEEAVASGKNGLIILANDDKISAFGPSSRFGLIHDVFGIPAVDEGIEISTHGMNVSFEYVVEQDPDLLYVVDRSAAVGEGESAKQIVENKLMERTKAMQNDDIIYLDPDVWYLSGGGLISVSEMIGEVEASLQ